MTIELTSAQITVLLACGHMGCVKERCREKKYELVVRMVCVVCPLRRVVCWVVCVGWVTGAGAGCSWVP